MAQGLRAGSGVLDASECPPTFGTPPEMVVGLIAGGPSALTRAIEGAEDDPDRGAADLAALGVASRDLVVGIASSGRTPYVLGAVREARREGAATVGISCNRPSLLGQQVHLEIATSGGSGDHRRLDPAESGNRNQDGPQHDFHRGHDQDRQDAG